MEKDPSELRSPSCSVTALAAYIEAEPNLKAKLEMLASPLTYVTLVGEDLDRNRQF